MKKVKVRCARCGKSLFFLLPENKIKERVKLEIKCYKDRCEAMNIVDYRGPGKLSVTLKEE